MKTLLFFILFLSSLFANPQKEILLLHSYNSGLKWSDNITNGVKDILDKYPNYELTIEYMDSKKINTKEYFDSLLNHYEKKFSNRKYDAIITADNYAFNFAMLHHNRVFNSSPIVFCGVENFSENLIPKALKPFVTGVVEYKEIDKNIKMISKTIPKLNTLYIISDNLLSSLEIKEQILNAAKNYENNFQIIYDNKIDMDTILEKINSLPQNSVILFTSLYSDIKGRYIPYPKVKELFENSKYPIFALNKIHLGEGIVGGIVVDPHDQGVQATIKVVEIINGKEVSKIAIETPSSKYYFDYNVLKKFDLIHSNIPILATIINEPKTFFEEHRKFIDSAFLLMPLLILLIIGLIVNIVKRVQLEIKLLEQNRLDSVLLNNIKSAIYWKSKDDKILGCNDSLCEFLDLPKEKLLGQHLKDVMPQIFQLIDDTKGFQDEVEGIIEQKNRKINVFIRRKKYLNKNNIEAGVVTVINDVTQLRKLENQRKKDEQFIIQRTKLSEIGEMMTSIAHQWKAPLIEISTIAQELLYKRSKKELSKEDSKEFVDEIMTQVSYMTKTIDDFRNFIKPSLQKSDFEINSAISELLSVIEHNLKYNYIEVKVNYENDKRFIINGYSNEFKQCILNIINNCRDSILKRKQIKSIQGKIEIEIFSENGFICICIKDNGIGIKDENLEKIFEPFYTSKENGDGFGLYMVKLIIEDKMNGEIKALKYDDGAHIKIAIKEEKL